MPLRILTRVSRRIPLLRSTDVSEETGPAYTARVQFLGTAPFHRPLAETSCRLCGLALQVSGSWHGSDHLHVESHSLGPLGKPVSSPARWVACWPAEAHQPARPRGRDPLTANSLWSLFERTPKSLLSRALPRAEAHDWRPEGQEWHLVQSTLPTHLCARGPRTGPKSASSLRRSRDSSPSRPETGLLSSSEEADGLCLSASVTARRLSAWLPDVVNMKSFWRSSVQLRWSARHRWTPEGSLMTSLAPKRESGLCRAGVYPTPRNSEESATCRDRSPHCGYPSASGPRRARWQDRDESRCRVAQHRGSPKTSLVFSCRDESRRRAAAWETWTWHLPARALVEL